MNIKIGICYAEEDSGALLNELMKRLTSNPGVFISHLKILPDSNQDSSKVIDIREFSAVIVIISENSIGTNLINDALKLAVKQDASSRHKIIPVLIDQSIAEEFLPSNQFADLFNHDDYLYGLYKIKTLAGMHLSEYLNSNFSIRRLFNGLTENINEIYLKLCNRALVLDQSIISIRAMFDESHANLSYDFDNSLQELEEERLIEQFTKSKTIFNKYSDFIRLTNPGINKYFYAYYQNYIDVRKSVIELILDSNSGSKIFMLKSEIISKVLRQPKLVINTILEDLELSGKLTLRRTYGENWEINRIEHQMFANTLKRIEYIRK